MLSVCVIKRLITREVSGVTIKAVRGPVEERKLIEENVHRFHSIYKLLHNLVCGYCSNGVIFEINILNILVSVAMQRQLLIFLLGSLHHL